MNPTAAPPMNADAVTPWYRQRWPWLLMLGPAIVVVAGISTAVIALETDDGLVADDYYKRGLGINQTLERASRSAALGLAATVDVSADGAVVVVLDSASSAPKARPTSLRFRLAHPTRAGEDRAATLVPSAPGRYTGRVTPVHAGRWRVIVETDVWRLPGVETSTPIAGVRLTPPAAG